MLDDGLGKGNIVVGGIVTGICRVHARGLDDSNNVGRAPEDVAEDLGSVPGMRVERERGGRARMDRDVNSSGYAAVKLETAISLVVRGACRR